MDTKTNDKIKVLQVMDKCAIRNSPIHGVSRLLLTWWPGFVDTNIELSLAVLRAADNTCKPFTNVGIKVEDLNRSKVDPRTFLDLIKLIKKDNIDILHCHGYGATTFGRIAGLLTKTPVIVHEHMIDENIPGYQVLADKILAPFTAKGIAISAAVKNFMTGKRAISNDKMEIVFNSIPDKYFEAASEMAITETANKYGISKDQPIIGIVGRLDPIKGHTDFINAAKIILNKFPELLFVIVGDGEIRSQLEAQTKHLKIDAKVKFLGHCTEIHELVSLMDIVAVSSHQEGFSLAAIEAMALGKPVVATNVGGLPDVIDDDETGILVEPHNPAQLAEGIEKLLDNSSLAEKFSANGKNKCRTHFSLSSTVTDLTNIYYSVYQG